DGELDAAVRARELRARLARWTVFGQVGATFAERLAHAHAVVPGARIQIGMDTPHARIADLEVVAGGLREWDAVLAPAADGGWWALALPGPEHAPALIGVAMSTASTYRHTAAALRARGLRVGTSVELRDVDTVADAKAVAAISHGAFSRAWADHQGSVPA
ncbi:MAG: DUF2064 domain-containing protein, partial [Nocardioides sp.]